MTRSTRLVVTDDFDGTEIDVSGDYKPLTFAVDGELFEIDVKDEHRAEFMELIYPWTEAATKLPKRYVALVGGTARSATSPSLVPTSRRPTRRDPVQVAAIRQWARDHGFPISDRGRIPGEVEAAYNERAQRAS